VHGVPVVALGLGSCPRGYGVGEKRNYATKGLFHNNLRVKIQKCIPNRKKSPYVKGRWKEQLILILIYKRVVKWACIFPST
jgi:hypothetical protein